MSVYAPLQDHLKFMKYRHWKASFTDIERVLKRPLPKSAYNYPAWWANQEGTGHSQTAAWRDAGWRTMNLDLAAKTVEFERIERSESKVTASREPADLLRKAAMYFGTTDKDILYREGLKALIEREAARRLARLGGSSPHLEPAPRRRTTDG